MGNFRFVLLAVALAAVLLFGCTAQEAPKNEKNETSVVIKNETKEDVDLKAEKGDLVAVDYLGTLEDGTVFDTSIKEEAAKAGLELRPSYSPLEFTVGAGQMIKGFDDAVVGMAAGEEKTILLAPSEAYGERFEDRVVSVNRTNVPEEVKVGTQLMASTGVTGVVVSLDNESVKIDFNHPLAGKALKFKIMMRKITKK